MGLFEQFLKEKSKSESSSSLSSFKDLDDLIKSGVKEIVLTSDIRLDINEEVQYPEGIIIDRDDLVIDGNGHSIDSQNRTRMFKVFGKNITIKNISFKNGQSVAVGAIECKESGDLKIIDCRFSENYGQSIAGAIGNFGKISLINCSFTKNSTQGAGGTISNQAGGSIEVINSNFEENRAEYAAGAIHNRGKISLKDSSFINNSSYEAGGALINFDIMNIENCRFDNNATTFAGVLNNLDSGTVEINNCEFMNNRSGEVSGVLGNLGRMSVRNSKFFNNSSKNGGAIVNQVNAQLTISGCEFIKNEAIIAGAIATFGRLDINASTFKSNRSTEDGGAINVQNGALNIADVKFIKNKTGRDGGAIFNLGMTDISGTVFDGNSSKDYGGAINHQEGILNITNSEFVNNREKKYMGEAIDSNGTLGKDARFNEEISEKYSGAIWSHGKNILNVADCRFNDNTQV